jgi:superfamily I DNA/RNA helicase
MRVEGLPHSLLSLALSRAQMVGDAGMVDDIGGRFDHVLVDEYQVTNRLESSILRRSSDSTAEMMATLPAAVFSGALQCHFRSFEKRPF